MTNILQVPRVQATVQINNNEDWLDALCFFQADRTTPISLEGIAAVGTVRKDTNSAAVLTMSTANGSLAIVGNRLSWQVRVSTLRNVPPGSYTFDVQLSGDGTTRTIISGGLTILPGVTR